MIQPLLKEMGPFTVCGPSVRTQNSDELNQNTAKIPQLWGGFFADNLADQIPHRIQGSPVYGVYSHYESDANSFYTLTAGLKVLAPSQEPGFTCIDVMQGSYLMFSDRGTMPEVIIKTWNRVWDYFKEHHEIERCYATDFEVYLGPDEVAVYIGIK